MKDSRKGDGIIAFDITIKDYLKEIDESPLLTVEEERELARLIIEENDPLARDQLVRSNLRLVVKIAKNYGSGGMSLGDLIEEGNLGLIKAVDYFDPDRGTRFSTYAAWWIRQSIKLALLSNVQPVHIPSYMVALINQWRKIAKEVENRLGRPPGIKEMAELMGMSLKKAKIIYDVVSVLATVKDAFGTDEDNEGQMLEASLPDQNMSRPEDALTAFEEKDKVLKLLNEINPRQANILKLHYGLDGNKPLTIRQIGEKLALTRERIRQLHRQALTQLYEYMNED